MDYHTRKALNIYPQKEESFYHSSQYSPDDMVCEGSDDDLTDEELRVKRLRYEDHAQKYMRGCMPVLQSAKLRGPLEDRREWSNPWRFHPPARRITKSKVLQSRRTGGSRDSEVVNHTNPYSEPAASTVPTSSAINATASSPRMSHPKTTLANTDRQSLMATGRSSSDQILYSSIVPVASHNSPNRSQEGQRIEAATHKPRTEAQWLKGSYVSKQARWHDIDVETPTPNPNTYNQRFQRIAQGTDNTQVSITDRLGSKPSSSFPDLKRKTMSTDSRDSSGFNRTIELSRSVFQHIQPSGQPLLTSPSFGSHSEYTDHAQRQPTTFSSPLYESPSALVSEGRSTKRFRSSLRSEHTPAFSIGTPNIQFSDADTLPNLPVASYIDDENSRKTPEDEVSFITEVAPSSRNVEEFQYRKKRVKDSLSVSASRNSKASHSKSGQKTDVTPNPDDPMCQQSVQEIAQDLDSNYLNVSLDVDDHSDIKSETGSEEDEMEDVLASGPYLQWYKDSPAKESSMIESTSQDEGLGTSQNNEVASTAPRMSSRTREVIAGVKSPRDNNSSMPNPRTAPHSSGAIPHSDGRSASPGPVSHSRLQLPTATQASFGYTEPRGTNGSSTQSFNTTPAKSSGRSLLHQSPFHPQYSQKEIIPKSAGTPENLGSSNQVSSSARPTSGAQVYHDIQTSIDSPPSWRGNQPPSPVRNERSQQCSNTDEGNTSPLKNVGSASSDAPQGSMSSVRSKVNTPGVRSQVTKPGEQSPWAPLGTQTLPCLKENTRSSVIITSEPQGLLRREGLYDRSVDSDWEAPNHQTTPENDGMKLFSDMVTPPPPSRSSNKRNQRHPANNESTAADALNNPWTSAMSNKTAPKSSKRVSFGILSDQSNSSSQEHEPRPLGNSPPPQSSVDDIDEEEMADGSTAVPKFQKHFSVFKEPKDLLQNDSVPVASPSIGAMAEAFIAADHETSIEEQRRLRLAKSARHLKPSSPSMVNAVRRESITFETSSSPDIPNDSPTRDTEADTQKAGFDMEDALGGFADFLGDWSVEGELQKARNASQAKSQESNGAKRRRLFGIV